MGRLPLSIALLALAGFGSAHVRLHLTGDPSSPLAWSNPSQIAITINSLGSDNIADGSHETALRNAIEAWNAVPGSSAQLVEDTDPAEQARTDWAANGIHLVMFDEDNSSGYFPGGSSTVAITPVQFNSGSGQITDADVLYNGMSFNFTTSGQPGRFDVQDVGAHELGHLLGLDHTGWGGGTMFPYVSPAIIAHRSLSLDDENGLRDAYPSAGHASISGVVRRQSDDSAVAGAHVVCRDADGRTAGATLSHSNGGFTLEGLAPGTYELVAHPFDGAVDASNLQAGYTFDLDFDASFGAPIAVALGEAAVYGDLEVSDPAGSVVLGTGGSSLPLRAIHGQNNVGLALSGAGLALGSSLSVSDPDMTLANVVFSGGQVTFQLDVPAGEEPGHVDLLVTNVNGSSYLPAAIEVTPPDPAVADVTPSSGSLSGGTAVTITGTGFRPGARVVIGPLIYRDGDPGVAVVDETTLTLTTQATPAGLYDVVVIDPTGFEGRQVDAFEFQGQPAIASVFPPAGSIAGGTDVVILGQDFAPGSTVEIDGVAQPQVTFEHTGRLSVRTEAKGGAVAGAVLRVTVPGGAFADSAFSYSAQLDPFLADVSPSQGPPSGGSEITLSGSGFTASSQVLFGADPDTGLGGTPAASVAFVDANTLEVTTPAFAKGKTSVLVVDGATSQAYAAPEAFTFKSSSGGGGGGGCYTETLVDPLDPRELVLGTWWLAALLGVLCLRRRRLAASARGLAALAA